MDRFEIMMKLKKCFRNSFVNDKGEFIAHERSNEYFNLKSCGSETEVKCKVLEYLSRGAFKSQPYNTEKSNKKLHDFMLNGINDFLGTNFTKEEIAIIYQNVGNGINHRLTHEFVDSGYDMRLLKKHTSAEVIADNMETVSKLLEWSKWKDADREGRLVVLPCKVGDTVYSISGMKIQEEIVSGIEYRIDYFGLWSNEDEWIGILGNGAYLTREEAEVALEKMKGEAK